MKEKIRKFLIEAVKVAGWFVVAAEAILKAF